MKNPRTLRQLQRVQYMCNWNTREKKEKMEDKIYLK